MRSSDAGYIRSAINGTEDLDPDMEGEALVQDTACLRLCMLVCVGLTPYQHEAGPCF